MKRIEWGKGDLRIFLWRVVFWELVECFWSKERTHELLTEFEGPSDKAVYTFLRALWEKLC